MMLPVACSLVLLPWCHRTVTLLMLHVCLQWRIAFEIGTTYPEPLWFVDIVVDLAIVFDICLNLRRQVHCVSVSLYLSVSLCVSLCTRPGLVYHRTVQSRSLAPGSAGIPLTPQRAGSLQTQESLGDNT